MFTSPTSFNTSASGNRGYVGDFNDDDFNDILVVGNNAISVLLNNDGTSLDFNAIDSNIEVLGEIAVADFNNDNSLDIAARSGQSVTLFRGDGNGNFGAESGSITLNQYGYGNTFVTGDFNGDSNADLASIGFGSSVELLLGDGAGNFTRSDVGIYAAGTGISERKENQIFGLVSAQVTGDAKTDLIALSKTYSFGETQGYLSQMVASVIAGGNPPSFTHETEFDASEQSEGYFNAVIPGNFNSDSQGDLALFGNGSQGITTLLSTSNGFDEVNAFNLLSEIGSGVSADFNGDTFTDLAVTSGSGLSLLFGDGNGKFVESELITSGVSGQLYTGDFNQDNRPDLAVISGNTVQILLNEFDQVEGVVNFGSTTAFVKEGELLAIPISLNQIPSRDVEVTIAVKSSSTATIAKDFTLTTTTLTFAANTTELTQIINLQALSDSLDDSPENVTLEISSVNADSRYSAGIVGEIDITIHSNLQPTGIELSDSTIAENSDWGDVVGDLSTVDPDSNAHSYRLLDSAGGRFRISGNQLVVGNGYWNRLNYEQENRYEVTIESTDKVAPFGTVAQTFVIDLTDANDPPQFEGVLSYHVTAAINTPFSLNIPEDTFTDEDNGDLITYSAITPDWMEFDPETRTFSGTPLDGDIAQNWSDYYDKSRVQLIATDRAGASTSASFYVPVVDTDLPIVQNSIRSQAFNWTYGNDPSFAANSYTDPDGGAISYSVVQVGGDFYQYARWDWGSNAYVITNIAAVSQPLPDWLTFDPSTRRLNVADDANSGFIRLMFIATDSEGNSVGEVIPFSRVNKSGFVVDGYIANSQVFLDANKNGKLDSSEPVTMSDGQGRYELNIDFPTFDKNNNGRIDPAEGQIVAIGGVDTATGLPLETPVKSTPNADVITLLTSLVTELVGNGTDLETANRQVAQALGLPSDTPIANLDPIAATDSIQGDGAITLGAMVKVQNSITALAGLLSGASALDMAAITDVAIKILADRIQTGAVVNLTTKEDIQGLALAISAAIADLDTSFDADTTDLLIPQIASTLAVANTRVDVLVSTTEGRELLKSIADLQTVILGKATDSSQGAVPTGASGKDLTITSRDPSNSNELPSNSDAAELSNNLNGSTPIIGTDDGDRLVGNDANNILLGRGGNDTVQGNGGDDILGGNQDNDWLDGGLGNDILVSGRNDDTLIGGDGNDFLWGNRNNDYLDGGNGNDTLIGGNGGTAADDLDRDTLDGGAGDDLLTGNIGQDSLLGGLGEDTLYGGLGKDTLDGGEGNDTLFGNLDTDLLLGGQGNDAIFGQAGSDQILGGMGLDSLFGGQDNDSLSGGANHDFVAGEAGDDTLVSGLGEDTLVGGAGADVLVLGTIGVAIVDDFVRGEDRFVLDSVFPPGFLDFVENRISLQGQTLAIINVGVDQSDFIVI